MMRRHLTGPWWPWCVIGKHLEKRRAAQRRHQIERSLPELLDLLVLCVEAGYPLEQALAKIGQELSGHHPLLTHELKALSLELTAGSGRARALQQMALRVGSDALNGLVSLLIQSERFGTRVSDALVAQAEHVRTRRRRMLEKKAAVMGLKLLFPLIFCIFPALLVVLVGPAFLSLWHSLQS